MFSLFVNIYKGLSCNKLDLEQILCINMQFKLVFDSVNNETTTNLLPQPVY